MLSEYQKILKISAWNIHGLGEKFKDENLPNLFNNDINILLETWKEEHKQFNKESQKT